MRWQLAALAACLFACGGSPSTSADPAAYQALVASSEATVTQHRQVAATTDVASCQAERDRYAAQMQGQLRQMQQLSPAMDGCMSAMGRSAGMVGRCTDLQAELHRHLGQACTGTPAQMREELQRHCDAMQGWLQQDASQVGQMSGMGMMGGTTGGGGGGRMGSGMACGP